MKRPLASAAAIASSPPTDGGRDDLGELRRDAIAAAVQQTEALALGWQAGATADGADHEVREPGEHVEVGFAD